MNAVVDKGKVAGPVDGCTFRRLQLQIGAAPIESRAQRVEQNRPEIHEAADDDRGHWR